MTAVQPPGVTANVLEGHWLHHEVSPRWIRVTFNGENIADSKRVMLVRETGFLPVYYFPRDDVRSQRLVASAYRSQDPFKGEATYWSVAVGDRQADDAAWSYPTPLKEWPEIGDYVGFVWSKMDSWYEEEEEVFVHPRDPYKRVDVMPSSRRVEISIDGVKVADSRNPRLLFETGLPVRYYLPKEDVRPEFLVESDTHSRCPYKGLASYQTLKVNGKTYPDYVWHYENTIPECPKIHGLYCFFNERVDITIDGEPQPRPKTKWSVD